MAVSAGFCIAALLLVVLTASLVWLSHHRFVGSDRWFIWSAAVPYVLCWGIPMAAVSLRRASYALIFPIILGALLSVGLFITGLVLIRLRLKERKPVMKLAVATLIAAVPAYMVFFGKMH